MTRMTLAALLALLLGSAARAEWVLDGEESALTFVSTKAVNVAEVHRFGEMAGTVDEMGNVDVSIDLSSVDTGIEIRDQRMREMLFYTGEHPQATLSAKLDEEALDKLNAGESVDTTLEAMLTLHGETRPLMLDVTIARTGESRALVATRKPVLINASEFNLAEGVEALRQVAGLPSISLAVPVSFVLVFDEQQ